MPQMAKNVQKLYIFDNYISINVTQKEIKLN